MLVLNRRVSEIVRIGEAVAVRVLGVKDNQVRLGIEAPGDVSTIVREEIAVGVGPEKSAGGEAKRRSR